MSDERNQKQLVDPLAGHPSDPGVPASSLRILFICRSFSVGGAERQLALLARGLSECGHDISIVTFYAGGPLEADLAGTRVRLVRLEKKSRYDVLGPITRLRHQLSVDRPHIVHGYLTVPNIASLIALTARPRPKIVWGLRASDMQMARYDILSRATHWLETVLSPLADHVIVNSAAGAVAARRRGFVEQKLTTIPNAIDPFRFRPDALARQRVRKSLELDPNTILVGHVGRVDPMKDHQSFLQALAFLADRTPQLRGICVASGSDADIALLRRLIENMGLSRRVILSEARNRIEETLAALDILCMSSRYGEGFPNVVAEAMACGVPCVVTAVGDAPAIVGSSGEVATPGDPSDIARQLERLIKRLQAEGDALRADVRNRSEEFSLSQLVLKTEAVLRRTLQASE